MPKYEVTSSDMIEQQKVWVIEAAKKKRKRLRKKLSPRLCACFTALM